jgi:NADPH:quinone reductase-like Zn-dependent oxidoreductase
VPGNDQGDSGELAADGAGLPTGMTVWTTAGDGIAQLVTTRAPIPVPGAHEVVVRISAVALNYRDLLVINGVDGWAPPRPVVPISDAVGTVVRAGKGVTRFGSGDRISAAFLPQWRSGSLSREVYVRPTGGPVNRGMLAQFVAIDENEAVRTPRSLDDVQAATLPIAAVTAWHAVGRRSRVRPGDTVLVHGTGGVALFAAQLSLALGARPIVTSSSEEKLAKLAELGVTDTINYRATADVAAAALALTDGLGVDHVIETVGGANLNTSLAAVRIGGTISFVGLIAGLSAQVNTYDFVTKNVTIHGIETGSQEMYEELAHFVDDHGVTPVVDSVYPVSEIAAAFRHLEQGRHFGKIVVTLE